MDRLTTILFAVLLSITTGCSISPIQEYESQSTTPSTSTPQDIKRDNEIDRKLKDLKTSTNAQADPEDEEAMIDFIDKLNEVTALFQTKSPIPPSQFQELISELGSIQFSIDEKDYKSALNKLFTMQGILEVANNPVEATQLGHLSSEISTLDQSIHQQNNAINEIKAGPITIPFPFFLTQISSLIGLISLLIAIAALSRVKKQKTEVEKLIAKSRKFENNLNNMEYDIESTIRPTQKDNRSRIDKLEIHSKQQDNARKVAISSPTTDRYDKPADQITPSYVAPEPIRPNKSMLVTALNSGDRQQLKEAMMSQLNITSKSENDILIGRSTVTELEEVSAGGSYQLIIIDGQSWLFPTEQTLNGFTAAQSSKGIFECEEQVISNPQLLEPALLEKSGNNWNVKQVGKINIPRI